MNTLHYTKKNNSYFLEIIYPSGRGTGKERVTKNDFETAKKQVLLNKNDFDDLIVNDNEVYFTEK